MSQSSPYVPCFRFSSLTDSFVFLARWWTSRGLIDVVTTAIDIPWLLKLDVLWLTTVVSWLLIAVVAAGWRVLWRLLAPLILRLLVIGVVLCRTVTVWYPSSSHKGAEASLSSSSCANTCEQEEEGKCRQDDNTKGYPSSPGIPGRITPIRSVVVRVIASCSLIQHHGLMFGQGDRQFKRVVRPWSLVP